MNDLELYRQAKRARWFGNTAKAIEICSRADSFKCDLLKSRLVNRGPHYTKILARYHRRLQPKCYLEIGVADGDTFTLSKAPTTVGVDPAVDRPGVYRMMSDEFFNEHGSRFQPDMAFIDGSHDFDDALRDFINVERIMTPKGVIFLHDILPLDERTATKERHTQFWSGDIWRLHLLLREQRPDLSLRLFRVPPTGLLMVSGLDPASSRLGDDYTALVAAYNQRSFADRIR